MQKILLLALLIIGSATYAQNEQLVVRGKIVTTSENGEEIGVPGVKLRWMKDKGLGSSDLKGYFEIPTKSLPDTLIISYSGFKTIHFNITDTSQVYTFNLKEGVVLDGV